LEADLNTFAAHHSPIPKDVATLVDALYFSAL